MVSDRLREVMLRAEGVGELTGPEVHTGRAEHPVCGDQILLHVRFLAGNIEQLRWQANGCPAAMAVAALASVVLPGTGVGDGAEHAARTRCEAHGGLRGARAPRRRPWSLRALAQAAATTGEA
jgi:NifU-like protein involved in Fe-S cluster formation